MKITMICPTCGATTSTRTGVCEYCGSALPGYEPVEEESFSEDAIEPEVPEPEIPKKANEESDASSTPVQTTAPAPKKIKKVNKKKIGVILGSVIAVGGVVAGIWGLVFSGCFDHYESGAVDLGLSVKWASCNVGATSPEEFGDYYAWGELSEKDIYDEDNWMYDENQHSLPISHDVANQTLGGKWRMPTPDEFEELIASCRSEWVEFRGVAGVKFTSKINGNSIFLPVAGVKYDDLISTAQGGYWSSHQINMTYDFFGFEDFGPCALFIEYADDENELANTDVFDPWGGFSVRPVTQ